VDVFVANEQAVRVDEARLAALARHALEAESVEDEAELSILAVDREHIQRLNNRFADNNYPTDVLAFPMSEDEEEVLLLGDVVICPEIAQRNAKSYGAPLTDELDVLVVHGILHLLGYDHEADGDRTRMERRTKELVDSFSRSLI
jgi:probable rRNA maturation factor